LQTAIEQSANRFRRIHPMKLAITHKCSSNSGTAHSVFVLHQEFEEAANNSPTGLLEIDAEDISGMEFKVCCPTAY
jgi:hypothetical protein